MESECTRCHRKFQSSSEEMTVCPDCLRDEFAPARPLEEAGAGKSIKQVNALSLRRAAARAERLSGGLQSGAALSPFGMMRFVLGVVIFFTCVFIFLYCSKLEQWQVDSFMPSNAQRAVSLLFCWVAAALAFSSASRQNRWFVYPVVFIYIVSGWFMPDFWRGVASREKKDTAAAIASSRVGGGEAYAATEKKVTRSGRELTEEDLAIFREKKQKEGSDVNYGIYINTRDVGLRQGIRDTIARLLEAESCVPYTRGQGSLFIVSKAAGGKRNISRIAARFGDLNYADPAEGIYEVDFLPDKVHAVSHYPTEALSSPAHESFIAANVAELQNLLDPHRVRTAANALAAADVQVQRDKVRGVLIEVLRDPWVTQPDTYEALIETLALYAAPGDREAVDMCRKCFLYSRTSNRAISPAVMQLLIREVPDEMVAPVVELWCSNPVEWGNMLAQLGTRTQEHLLDVLENTQSLQLIGPILKHLEHNGTPEAAPVVQKFINHPDSLISHTARATLRALGGM